MFIKTEQLQEVGNKILQAVDTDSTTGDKLELKVVNSQLQLNVSNREYYAQVIIDGVENEEFNAVVDAKLFFSLVSKITTKDIELKTTTSTLILKANGSYKLPLIYEGNSLVNIGQIVIENPTTTFDVSSEILLGILNYNSKVFLDDGNIKSPLQKLYYVDENGCVTFTSDACVNSFTLPHPVKLLLNQKLVKLFRLFKDGDVKFTLGYDEVAGKVQTKVKFETKDITITAITSTDDQTISKFPKDKVRQVASGKLDYVVEIDRFELILALTRILILNNARGGVNKNFAILEFSNDSVSIYDLPKENREVLKCNIPTLKDTYELSTDIAVLKSTLDSCAETNVSISFGNKQCIILSRGNVKNVIPEANRKA